MSLIIHEYFRSFSQKIFECENEIKDFSLTLPLIRIIN